MIKDQFLSLGSFLFCNGMDRLDSEAPHRTSCRFPFFHLVFIDHHRLAHCSQLFRGFLSCLQLFNHLYQCVALCSLIWLTSADAFISFGWFITLVSVVVSRCLRFSDSPFVAVIALSRFYSLISFAAIVIRTSFVSARFCRVSLSVCCVQSLISLKGRRFSYTLCKKLKFLAFHYALRID